MSEHLDTVLDITRLLHNKAGSWDDIPWNEVTDAALAAAKVLSRDSLEAHFAIAVWLCSEAAENGEMWEQDWQDLADHASRQWAKKWLDDYKRKAERARGGCKRHAKNNEKKRLSDRPGYWPGTSTGRRRNLPTICMSVSSSQVTRKASTPG